MSHLRYHIKHKKVVLSDRSRCRTGLVVPLLVNNSLLSLYNYKTKEKEVKRLHAEVYIHTFYYRLNVIFPKEETGKSTKFVNQLITTPTHEDNETRYLPPIVFTPLLF